MCNENKGADQLRSYPKADLRLCFRIAKSWFSHDMTIFIYKLHNHTIINVQYTHNEPVLFFSASQIEKSLYFIYRKKENFRVV